MGEFFGSIYCWFEEFFGIELANYLWGESSLLSQTNSFIGIGWSMFGISFAMVLIYYYVINHPQLNHWWGWIIFLVINGIINFIVGWQWVLKDYYDGKMSLEDAVELIKQSSRRYAKRQLTWFRRDDRIHYVGSKNPFEESKKLIDEFLKN